MFDRQSIVQRARNFSSGKYLNYNRLSNQSVTSARSAVGWYIESRLIRNGRGDEGTGKKVNGNRGARVVIRLSRAHVPRRRRLAYRYDRRLSKREDRGLASGAKLRRKEARPSIRREPLLRDAQLAIRARRVAPSRRIDEKRSLCIYIYYIYDVCITLRIHDTWLSDVTRFLVMQSTFSSFFLFFLPPH